MELLVVVAILGLLAVLLVPALQRARESGRRLACLNNLRQLGIGAALHADGHGRFPAGSLRSPDGTSWGLTVPLLPYLEEQAAFATVVLGRAGACSQIRSLQAAGKPDPASRPIAILNCPSDPRAGASLRSGPSGPLPTSGDCGLLHPGNYLGMSGDREAVDAALPINKCYTSRGLAAGSGIFYDDSRTRQQDVTDGLSKTITIGERGLPEDLGWGWVIAGGQECEQYIGAARGIFRPVLPIAPEAIDETLLRWWSWHPAGPQFAFGDSSCRLIAADVDPVVFQALSTRAGGEVVTVP